MFPPEARRQIENVCRREEHLIRLADARHLPLKGKAIGRPMAAPTQKSEGLKMREELLCWFAVLFTLCVAWLWVDLLRERREARRERTHKGNTQTPPAVKSPQNARKRPLRTERTPGGRSETPAASRKG